MFAIKNIKAIRTFPITVPDVILVVRFDDVHVLS